MRGTPEDVGDGEEEPGASHVPPSACDEFVPMPDATAVPDETRNTTETPAVPTAVVPMRPQPQPRTEQPLVFDLSRLGATEKWVWTDPPANALVCEMLAEPAQRRRPSRLLTVCVTCLTVLLLIGGLVKGWSRSSSAERFVMPVPYTPTQQPLGSLAVPPSSGGPAGDPTPTSSPILTSSTGAIPAGTDLAVTVSPASVVAVTGGPLAVTVRDAEGHTQYLQLPGGIQRGSALLYVNGGQLLQRYTITDVWPGANWIGSYAIPAGKTPTQAWHLVVQDRIQAMQQPPPNCSAAQGCAVIDVVVIDASTDQLLYQSVIGQ